MKKLYQSELYTKHHWRIVGSILFILVIIGGKFTGNIFLPRVVYFILAGILFVWQLAMIKVCEENVEKRKRICRSKIHKVSKGFADPFFIS